MDQAFTMLRTHARSARLHLTAVALQVVDGTLALDEVVAAIPPTPFDNP